MPLKLVPPRPGNPNWQIRGSYLHVKRLYKSSGTPEKRVAQRALRKLERDIQSGAFDEEAGPTFVDAVESYLHGGGERRFIGPLNEYFQLTPLTRIDQAAIDKAAETLYPNADQATRNRQVYTPVSAILKRAGIEKPLRRPNGARGKRRLHWLSFDDASNLLAAAGNVEGRKGSKNIRTGEPSPRFQALLTFLLYTGCRLSEALNLKWPDVDLAASFVYVRDTKNGDPRAVFLPPVVVASLASLEHEGNSVFRHTKGGRLYQLLEKTEKASGVTIPDGIAFHIFRHTYAAWMRRHAGLDTSGLVATGAWKSADAARVYEHVEFSEEAAKAAMLPVRKCV